MEDKPSLGKQGCRQHNTLCYTSPLAATTSGPWEMWLTCLTYFSYLVNEVFSACVTFGTQHTHSFEWEKWKGPLRRWQIWWDLGLDCWCECDTSCAVNKPRNHTGWNRITLPCTRNKKPNIWNEIWNRIAVGLQGCGLQQYIVFANWAFEVSRMFSWCLSPGPLKSKVSCNQQKFCFRCSRLWLESIKYKQSFKRLTLEIWEELASHLTDIVSVRECASQV